MISQRLSNCTFDEILYADDTILVGTDTRKINAYLAELEAAAAAYGLRLNKDKCCVIAMYNNPNIKFADGTPVVKVKEAKYLGVVLAEDASILKEINARIKNTMATWRSLSTFWKHSNCSRRNKLIVFNAIIQAKLLYGLESAQLNDGLAQKLTTVQLKGLRQIMKMATTYVNRENTNKRVLTKANPDMHTNNMKRSERLKLGPTKSFQQLYLDRKGQILGTHFAQRRF